LDNVNLTELIELARKTGSGNPGRTLGREGLYEILDGAAATDPLEEKRALMEKHIAQNWRRLRTQLPGCNGKCTRFGCPDIIVQRCWGGFKNDLL
jgi:hypothetical protein